MLGFLYDAPFQVLEVPNLKMKRPSFVTLPSPMVVFAFILFTYFLVTGGIIYDVIVEPPSIGSTTDDKGNSRPVAFMQYRVNGQYIMEGLASSFLFTCGALGFIVLDKSNSSNIPKLNRTLQFVFAFIFIVISFAACRIFMSIKLP